MAKVSFSEVANMQGIIKGNTYIYKGSAPKYAIGHRYQVVDFVLDVPTYQRKVLVKALTGPDKGLLFTCTLSNFLVRYTPDDEPQQAAPPVETVKPTVEKVAYA